MSKPRLRVSFSGGRTSAYMAKRINDEKSGQFQIENVFANTGLEHPDTLRFVNEVDQHFGLNLTWVEAVVHPGRKSCTHKIVTYETASRNGEPFDAVCSKYGLPNHTFKLCTRELKTNVMASYSKSIGWKTGSHLTALGIRIDETRRVAASAEAQKIVYPLIDWWPTDKQDVLTYFEQFDWNLSIPEHEGNCLSCYKKSDKKLNRLYHEHPEYFEFPIRLDDLYGDVGPNTVPGPRKMFRGYRDTRALIAEFQEIGYVPPQMIDDGGCSESCEMYETMELDLWPETQS